MVTCSMPTLCTDCRTTITLHWLAN
uniref:Uncharacterized protein n=1 Tax=Anguilla anguilla TaxID=7936 RepID=A0A0E9PMG7_ANGAN